MKKNLLNFKKTLLLITCLLIGGSMFAQVYTFETLWMRTQNNGETRPDWFSTGDESENSHKGTERGIVYSHEHDKVFIASRSEGIPKVMYVNPETGEDEGQLLNTGMEEGGELDGGGYPMNNVVVTDDGQILGCNMTLNADSSATQIGDLVYMKAFRVYRWRGLYQPPELLINYQGKQGSFRLGDKISFTGSLDEDGGTGILYAVANDQPFVLRWTFTNGELDSEVPTVITLKDCTTSHSQESNSPGTAPNVTPLGNTTSDMMYVSGNGFYTSLYSAPEQEGGTWVCNNYGKIGVNTVACRSSRMTDYRGFPFMALYYSTSTEGAKSQNALVLDVTAQGPNVDSTDIIGLTPDMGTFTAYGAGGVDIAVRNDELIVYVCTPDNGIGAFKVIGLETLNLEQFRPDKSYVIRNYPNPFSNITTVEIDVPEGYNGNVRLEVYNTTGKLIKVLADKPFGGGKHRLAFDASSLPGGLYFCKMTAGNVKKVNKMVVVK